MSTCSDSPARRSTTHQTCDRVDRRKAGPKTNADRLSRLRPVGVSTPALRMGQSLNRWSRASREGVATYDTREYVRHPFRCPRCRVLGNVHRSPARRTPISERSARHPRRSSLARDDVNDITKKHDFYLSWGVKLVIIADPQGRTVEAKEQTNPSPTSTESKQSHQDLSLPSLCRSARSSPISTD